MLDLIQKIKKDDRNMWPVAIGTGIPIAPSQFP